MKITDPEVLKLMRHANSIDLNESIEEWDESERNGRTDMEILAEEVEYQMSLYEGNTATNEDYKRSTQILRETQYGKSMPMIMPYCVPRYQEWQIRAAKDSVNEHNRLKSLKKKLNSEGYY